MKKAIADGMFRVKQIVFQIPKKKKKQPSSLPQIVLEVSVN